MKSDSYPPLDDYAVIGDMRTAALVSRQGSIDWLCLPRFDSPSVFGRLLDWRRGGSFRVAPVSGGVTSRTYRTDSNVLETTWINGRDQAQVIDLMPVPARDGSGSLRLLRMIQPERGSLEWTIELQPGFDYARRRGRWRHPRAGVAIATSRGETLSVQYPESFTVSTDAATVSLRGRLEVGQPAVIALYDGAPRTGAPALRWEGAMRLLEETDRYWRTWVGQCRYTGRYALLARRSALVLKLFQYQPTGAFVAAPTTSLPESVGGALNWDYRYTWLRDMSVLVDTLHQLGFTEEVDDFMTWLDQSCECNPADFQMLYRVDGSRDVAEHELRHLEGYEGSRPVRIGNAAADQKQLDVYGEVMEAAHAAWKRARRMPRARRRILVDIVDHVIAHWQDPDAGIWESRARPKRYLYSQAMCWLALDRALDMDAQLRMGKERRAAAGATRSRIKREVITRGFNARVGAFTQALDDDTLDASGLTVPLTGMLPASDPRSLATVEAIRAHLMRGGLVYRYEGSDSEFQSEEGAFLVCSYWLVDVLAQMGRIEEAEELFASVSRTANDLGLFAEEFDPRTGRMIGNFPLALSHLSMLGALVNLERARTRRLRSAPSRPSASR